jgi:hypothetical protein
MPGAKLTAYMIVSYHQPRHLERMVAALDSEWSHFFVHIDCKVDTAPFRNSLRPRANLHILEQEQRETINYTGFGIVSAALNLMRAARALGLPFHRYAFLSGSDYPIKPLDQIQNAFATDTEYMRIGRCLNDLPDGNVHRNYVRYFWFTDHPVLSRLPASGRLKRELFPRLRLYHGSSWWAITGEAAAFVLDFVASNPDFRNYFRFTRVGDETFFQTILKASPYASHILQDSEAPSNRPETWGHNEAAHCYIDWSTPNVRLPKVLDLTDFEAIRTSQALFARKFEQGTSDALLDRVERELLRPATR